MTNVTEIQILGVLVVCVILQCCINSGGY